MSAAAGAVGSVACQIAKLKGAFVIGSAGEPEKCDFLRQLGIDYAIDYKDTVDLVAALETATQMVSTCTLITLAESILRLLCSSKPFARFALCGRISTYNDTVQGLQILTRESSSDSP